MEKQISKKVNAKLKRFKRTFFGFFAVLIFFIVFYYFFLSQKASEKDVPNYAALKIDSYQEYKSSISNTQKGIKALIENKQLEQINYYKDLFKNLNLEKKDNPFVKFF